MPLSIIVAVAENGVIGRDNAMPWHIPDDLKYFKRITSGKVVVMGRKTFQSIGTPLPNRVNVVLTRDPDWAAPGVTVVHSLPQALETAHNQRSENSDSTQADEVMIIGGADIFALALPLADRLYLTRVKGAPPGDTYFPPFDIGDWSEVSSTPGTPSEDGSVSHDFVVLERKECL
jgi:dihydrofolate reductase